MTSSDPHAALLGLFAGTPFRELEHPPAAAAADYHAVVGSRLQQQAKALFLRGYHAEGSKDYLVYALPGDRTADLEALAGRDRLRLATPAELFRATGCRFGELRPVGSIFGVELILDERLLAENELYFNTCRLDRSLVVAPRHLVALERPTIHRNGGSA